MSNEADQKLPFNIHWYTGESDEPKQQSLNLTCEELVIVVRTIETKLAEYLVDFAVDEEQADILLASNVGDPIEAIRRKCTAAELAMLAPSALLINHKYYN